jgi:Tol biopolymer transport system component
MLAIVTAMMLGSLSMAQTIVPLTEPVEFIGSPALSPDGTKLAFERWEPDAQIVIRAFQGGPAVVFAERDDQEAAPSDPTWSPDGQRIAFLRDYCAHCPHKLFLKSSYGGPEFPLGEVCGGAPSWTPDGKALITAEPVGRDEDCRLALIPADGSRRTMLIPKEGDVAAVSPNGRRLLYADGHVLKLAQLTSDFRIAGPPVAIASEPHEIGSINWTPDGHAVVFQSWSDGATYTKLLPMNGSVYSSMLLQIPGEVSVWQILPDGSALGTETIAPTSLWRMDTKDQAELKIRELPWTDSSPAVSPTGETMAFVTVRNGPSQIWVSKLDGSESRILVSSIPPYGEYGDNTMVGGLSWSPDGKWIAFLTDPGVGHGDMEARLFLIPSGGGHLRTLMELCSIGDIRWSADSRSVFVGKEREPGPAKPITDYFQVNIVTGKQTAVAESTLPPIPPRPTRAELMSQHLVEGGRFVYFTVRPDMKSRIVLVRELLPVAK